MVVGGGYFTSVASLAFWRLDVIALISRLAPTVHLLYPVFPRGVLHPCQCCHLPCSLSAGSPISELLGSLARLRRAALVNTGSCVLHRWGLMSRSWHSGTGNRISRSAPAEPRGKKWAFTSPGNHLAGRSEQGERFENILKCNE